MGLTPNVVANTPIASSWGNEIRDRSVQNFATAAERATQWAAPPEGALSYLRDVDRIEVWSGTTWVPLLTTAAWLPFTAVPTPTSGSFGTVSGVGAWTRLGSVVHYRYTATITAAGTAAGDIAFALPVGYSIVGSPPVLGTGRETGVSGLGLFVYASTTPTANISTGAALATGKVYTVSGTYEGL